MTIGQYDYCIEHKSGRKIPHADALSRYPPKDPNNPNQPDDHKSPSIGENNVAPLHAVHIAKMILGENSVVSNLTLVTSTDEKAMPTLVIAYLSLSLKAADLVPVIPDQ